MKNYIGITVGPIFDTISETTQPASLWFASSFFSNLTKRICEALMNSSLKPNIISPYYDKEQATEAAKAGVGTYHDRIIFGTDCLENKEQLDRLLLQIKRDSIDQFPADIFKEGLNKEAATTFLEEYIQTGYVILSGEEVQKNQNAILAMSEYLDALELAKIIPSDNAASPFKALFGVKSPEQRNDSDVYRNKLNEHIKNTSMFTAIQSDKSQLLRKGSDSIKSIEEIIAQGDTKLKSSNYYAVVAADGDGVGKVLAKLEEDEAVSDFSKSCLTYATQASEMVRAFGGMTIYAGGDDLLFMAPLIGEGQESLFSLCSRISAKFTETIKKGVKNITTDPTISFGVAARYKKYPLYETIGAARELLAYVKSEEAIVSGKNAIGFDLQKHSGQSISLYIPNEKVTSLEALLDEKGIEQENTLHSVIYTLTEMNSSIATLDAKQASVEQYCNAFSNFFDNARQEKFQEYLENLARFYVKHILVREGRPILAYNLGEKAKSIESLSMLLRLQKFMAEKGES